MLPETQSKRTFVFRKYYEKYKHLWILLYFFVYMAWFNYVEKTVTTHFHVIHVPIDDYIPFCEYFVIPYLLWFPFVGWGIAYMALHNKTDYYKLCAVFVYRNDNLFNHLHGIPERSVSASDLFHTPQSVHHAL